MAERKPLSKRTRFEVFKRDLFCCQYCGKNPPSVTLEVDHINPVSKGGTNHIDNLLTACFDCNRGKSNIELIHVPVPYSEEYTLEKVTLLREKQLQYKEYQKLLSEIESHLQIDADKIEDAFISCYPERSFTDNFKNSTVKSFIKKLGVEEVLEAIYISCSKQFYRVEDVTKYFCGICWKKIKKKYPEYKQNKEVENG